MKNKKITFYIYVNNNGNVKVLKAKKKFNGTWHPIKMNVDLIIPDVDLNVPEVDVNIKLSKSEVNTILIDELIDEEGADKNDIL